MPACSGARWWPGIIVLAACVLTAVACTSAAPARHAARPAAPRTPRPVATHAGTSLTGDPGWRITHPGHLYQLQGFADRTDVLPGSSLRLFVSTTARSFRVRAFRMGWYGGDLAGLVWTSPAAPGRYQAGAKIVQPGSMAVAPWQPSLTVPTTGWPPGSYLLRLDASTGVQSYVPMVIRSPSTAGRVVLVSAVTSYQAYNGWGRYSLYGGPAPTTSGSFADRGRRVTFDRPISYGNGAGAYFQLELPLVAFAERLGLPLAYLTSVDLDLDPGVLAGARAMISEGHDEYWSPAMRAAVTRARDQGMNVAFFGANAIFRKIRFESSPLGPDRIEVNYKIPQEDPLYGKDNALVTGNWPTPPDPDPESSLIGQSYVCSVTSNFPMVVTDSGSWVWAAAACMRASRCRGWSARNSTRSTRRSRHRGRSRCWPGRRSTAAPRPPTATSATTWPPAAPGSSTPAPRTGCVPCPWRRAARARPAGRAARHPGRHGEHPHRVRRRARRPRASGAGAHPQHRRPPAPARD